MKTSRNLGKIMTIGWINSKKKAAPNAERKTKNNRILQIKVSNKIRKKVKKMNFELIALSL